MRLRFPLFALLFIAGSLAIPHFVYAGIPFFGPIVPSGANSVCPAGWGMFMTVINNIIQLLITLAIVFVAPLMIAWAGFLMVVNQGNAGKLKEAKDILTNTIIGIVLALAGWMIVDAVMAVLYNGPPGTWASLVTSSGDSCLPQKGAMPGDGLVPTTIPPPGGGVVVVPNACSAMQALTNPPFTDSLAQQMEGGQTVIWTNTDSRLQPCVNKFIGKVGGTVTSAYRPQEYQTHLWEIHDRWCTQGLQSNSDAACSSLKSTVSAEVAKHGLSACMPVATNSNHSGGTAVDITGIDQSSSSVQQSATASCLVWFGSGDKVHYTLKSGCTCS